MFFFWALLRANLLAVIWATIHLLSNPSGENLYLLLGLIVFSGVIASADYMERQATANGGKIYAHNGNAESTTEHR